MFLEVDGKGRAGVGGGGGNISSRQIIASSAGNSDSIFQAMFWGLQLSVGNYSTIGD